MQTQVPKGYYFKDKYGSLSRFISYYYQISIIKRYRPQSLLFIGVGDGVTTFYLKNNLNFNLTTFDFDENLHPNIVGDVRNLAFKNSQFDSVAAFEVLEHIPFESFENTIKELSRIIQTVAFISVPYRHTGFEIVLKFPFIRTLLNKEYLNIKINIPIKFPGFEISKQHYWEIDNDKYKIHKIRSILHKYFIIEAEISPILHSYQKFFILKKRNGTQP